MGKPLTLKITTIKHFTMNKLILRTAAIIALTIFFVSCKKETPKVIPTITASVIANITANSATSGGTVTADGGDAITARGVCWSSTNGLPTISDSKTTDGSGLGEFASSITGLIPGTTYNIRAYATNSVGTVYGNVVAFKTPLAPILFNSTKTYGTLSDVDGNTYKTIQIGTQLWMAENLKTTKYKDVTGIPLVTDNATWGTLTTPGYCWFNNDETIFKSPYGALYNWFTVNTGKLCPAGWHIPTNAEWTTLTTYLGGESVAGGKLKETGTNHWKGPNTGATNETGFTSIPSGDRVGGGMFLDVGAAGYWWSSTEYLTSLAWFRYMAFDRSDTGSMYPDKHFGYSVRCLKD